VFECPAWEGVKDRYNGLLGDHAVAWVPFMWQHDTRALAQFVKECVDAHSDPSQALDQA